MNVQHRTSNIQCTITPRREIIKGKDEKQIYDQEERLLYYSVRIKKPELLIDILEETQELIKIFVTREFGVFVQALIKGILPIL